jgi:hypothetical protein
MKNIRMYEDFKRPMWWPGREYAADQVGEFWVETHPTADSTLADCCFSTDISGLVVQVQGGLTQEEVAGFFTKRADAEKLARSLMKKAGAADN